MFPEDHLEEMANHYARLALEQGWLEYTRHRVSEVQKIKMYQGLANRVKARMEEIKNANNSGLPASGLVPQQIQGQALGGDAQKQDHLP
jgi:hypothetical protein